MSNPILTVFDDAGNAIAIPAFPWVTEGSGGGGLKHASGTWTPAENTQRMIVELDFVPSVMAFWIDDFANKGLDGVKKIISGSNIKGTAFFQATNASGTSVTYNGSVGPDTTIVESDNSVKTPYIPRPRASGGFYMYTNYFFVGGYTYCWEAIE